MLQYDPKKNKPNEPVLKECPNFNWDEVACNCNKHTKKDKNGKTVSLTNGAATVDEDLIKGLQQLRKLVSDKLGKDTPLKLSCVYRCPDHNKAVGGVEGSFHTLGLAADIIRPKALSVQDFYELALQVPQFKDGGIGRYPSRGFMHVDVSTEPHKGRRWIG